MEAVSRHTWAFYEAALAQMAELMGRQTGQGDRARCRKQPHAFGRLLCITGGQHMVAEVVGDSWLSTWRKC